MGFLVHSSFFRQESRSFLGMALTLSAAELSVEYVHTVLSEGHIVQQCMNFQ